MPSVRMQRVGVLSLDLDLHNPIASPANRGSSIVEQHPALAIAFQWPVRVAKTDLPHAVFRSMTDVPQILDQS